MERLKYAVEWLDLLPGAFWEGIWVKGVHPLEMRVVR